MELFPTSAADWPEQKRLIEARIETHRDELEAGETVERIAFIQGQITALRWLLSSAEPEFRTGLGHARY